jgi:hypothetical protein
MFDFKSWFKSKEGSSVSSESAYKLLWVRASELHDRYGGNSRSYFDYDKDSSPLAYQIRKPLGYFHVFILKNRPAEELNTEGYTSVYLYMKNGEMIGNAYHAVRLGESWAISVRREGMSMVELDRHLDKYVPRKLD